MQLWHKYHKYVTPLKRRLQADYRWLNKWKNVIVQWYIIRWNVEVARVTTDLRTIPKRMQANTRRKRNKTSHFLFLPYKRKKQKLIVKSLTRCKYPLPDFHILIYRTIQKRVCIILKLMPNQSQNQTIWHNDNKAQSEHKETPQKKGLLNRLHIKKLKRP